MNYIQLEHMGLGSAGDWSQTPSYKDDEEDKDKRCDSEVCEYNRPKAESHRWVGAKSHRWELREVWMDTECGLANDRAPNWGNLLHTKVRRWGKVFSSNENQGLECFLQWQPLEQPRRRWKVSRTYLEKNEISSPAKELMSLNQNKTTQDKKE